MILFFSGTSKVTKAARRIPLVKKPLRVLSLFDGISSPLLALKSLNFAVEIYVASEISSKAIHVVDAHHPQVYQVGDIEKLSADRIEEMGPFDLVIGGSPCNELSGDNPYRKGLFDLSSSGRLFFEFKRCLDVVQQHRRELELDQAFWLFENVCSMQIKERDFITKYLRQKPVKIDAGFFSPTRRQRFFWGNIPNMETVPYQRPLPGDQITLQSCLAVGRTAIVEKINDITTNKGSLQVRDRHSSELHYPVIDRWGREDNLWTTEIEIILGFPKHYTDVGQLDFKDRLDLLGKSWSIPVVKRIFKGLEDYFLKL